MSAETIATLAKIGVWLVALLSVAPTMLWIERRIPAFMQDRLGPNRVGPLGLLQGIADAVKFIFKEEFTPANADRPLFLLAPVLALIPALTTYLVIPFGPEVVIGGHSTRLVVIDSDSGVLLFLALASLGVYSLVLAGYSSNNKYSMMGSIRASAQMVSYELALTTAVVCALIPAGTLNLVEVVDYQRAHLWQALTQPLGMLVFLVAAFAETNRLPFDLPEAESELVAGYLTEYGGLRWAMFFMGEYMSMTTLSALFVTLYFGGWSLPMLDLSGLPGLAQALIGFTVLAAKIALMLFLFVWVRWTFPRFRYDQLMRLGWKVLLPLAVVQLLATAALTVGGIL
ncbi:MAG: NADH-quinone oxidoreductase subunit NuoH [Thermoanaerobaculia bacterium]|nr:MAG: NADH-quinone oxidoreductase subunit NuoH [Thermoanaerobaculia bacterium]